jgi:predicted GNAT family acetyltransferase
MTDRPAVTVRDASDQQRFEAVIDGEVAGWIDYRLDGDAIDMHHTEVGDEWEGKGVASALVRGALDHARGAGHRVVPSCPFIERFLERNDGYADLVA